MGASNFVTGQPEYAATWAVLAGDLLLFVEGMRSEGAVVDGFNPFMLDDAPIRTGFFGAVNDLLAYARDLRDECAPGDARTADLAAAAMVERFAHWAMDQHLAGRSACPLRIAAAMR